MRLWHSVVGKLWMTILLLVSFVLIILTILLIQFFEKYYVNEIEQDLSDTAKKMSSIIESHRDDGLGEEIVFEIVDDPVGVAIAYNKDEFLYSPNIGKDNKIPPSVFLNDADLKKFLPTRPSLKRKYPCRRWKKPADDLKTISLPGCLSV